MISANLFRALPDASNVGSWEYGLSLADSCFERGRRWERRVFGSRMAASIACVRASDPNCAFSADRQQSTEATDR